MAGRNLLRCLCFLLALGGSAAEGKSYFSIIDDDAASVQAIGAIKQLADEKGIRITFAVTGLRLMERPDIADTLLSYQEQGFGVIDHSYSHDRDLWLHGDLEAVQGEIDRSCAVFDSLGFRDHAYLVYPYGQFPSERLQALSGIVGERYSMAFDSRGDVNRLDSVNPCCMARFPVRRHEHLSVVKLKIDKVADGGAWMVFLTHSASPRDYSSEYLGEIVDYCLSRGMECVTVPEAWREVVSRVPQTRQTRSYTFFDEICSFALMHLWYLLAFAVAIVFALAVLRRRSLRR